VISEIFPKNGSCFKYFLEFFMNKVPKSFSFHPDVGMPKNQGLIGDKQVSTVVQPDLYCLRSFEN